MGSPLSKDQARSASTIGNLNVRESTFKLEWMEKPWDDVDAAADWLFELEDEFEPDVVHLNGCVHGALPWRAPSLIVAHSCVLSWWQAVKGEPAPSDWHTYNHRVREGLNGTDLIIAPSRAMLRCLQEHYSPATPSRVIPNGCDLNQFSPQPKSQIILCAGRLWDEGKNVRAVCDAALEIPWPVCLAGDTQHPNGTDQLCENVQYLGKLAHCETIEWFSRAAIYAAPAKYEPFGLAILEAALSGCALVLGDIPSLRENWDGAALFVSPADQVSLRSAIKTLIDDESLRIELARRARDTALHFGISQTANNYLAAYSTLLRSGSPTSVPAITA